MENFEHCGEIIELWDIGGRWTIRTHFFPNTDGLIFVIDVNDRERLEEANVSLLDTVNKFIKLHYINIFIIILNST